MNIHEYALDDDIAAIATALSPAALSVIRTSGKNAIKKMAAVFSKPQRLLESTRGETIHGWLVNGTQKIDEAVLCISHEPKSFTGENCVEVICHGGVCITLEVFRLILSAGFRQAKPGEFTFRSFIAGKSDLTKAEAAKEIIDAKTVPAAESAAARLDGALAKKLAAAKNLILKNIAELDVRIEYPEDESGESETTDCSKASEAKAILESVIADWNRQKLFTDGAKVVLAGRPNSGKSRLFNALLNEERAIVSDIAGTTRDWLETDLNFSGLPVKLFDTAGLRYTAERIEKIGIDKTKALSERADLILYLIDSSRDFSSDCLSQEDYEFICCENYRDIKKIISFTKSDLLSTAEREAVKPLAAGLLEKRLVDAVVCISAKDGSGISELTDKCFSLLAGRPLQTENVSVGTERQKTACEKAVRFLSRAIEQAGQMPADVIVLDLEEALQFLAEVTGEVKNDDILGEIFSGFCVGK